MKTTTGARMALQKIHAQAERDKSDPRVIRWAKEALKEWLEKNGKKDPSPREIGEALLEAFARVRLPNTDADDASIAFAAALMSLGVETVFIGESYTADGSIHHVAVGVKERNWYSRFDPLYGHGPGHETTGRTRFEKFPWGGDCD